MFTTTKETDSYATFAVQRAKELQFYLQEDDLNRMIRRLMDYLVEFPISDPLKDTCRRLCAEYYFMTESAQRGNPLADEKRLEFITLAQQVITALGADAERNILENTIYRRLPNADLVFEGRGLTKSFSNKTNSFTLLNVDVQLRLGELTGLLGENGNGKTVLLKIIAGEFATQAGTLSYPLFNSIDWYTIKQNIAYIPQQLTKWNGSLVDNLYFSASIHGIRGIECQTQVEFYLQRLGLEKYRNASWAALSGGYKMRFELARMLVWKPKLLVLDEPLANLDVNAQLTFLQDLKDLARSTRYPFAVIISSQHLHEIENLVDYIIFLRQGRVLYNGPANQLDAHRADNTYEINCDLSPNALAELLRPLNIQSIQDTGQGVIVNMPLEIDSEALLQHLIQAKVKIHYFRDISQSTRKLFRHN